MSLEGAKSCPCAKLNRRQNEHETTNKRNMEKRSEPGLLPGGPRSVFLCFHTSQIISQFYTFRIENGIENRCGVCHSTPMLERSSTTLDRHEALILRRFRGIRVALMSLGKVVGRSLRNRRKMRRDSAPFLGFRRDPCRGRSDLEAPPVSARVGVRGPGRGGGCEKI